MKLRLHHRYSLVIVTLLLSAVMMIAGAAVVTFSSLSARTQAASARVMSDVLREQAISDGRDLVALASQIVATALNNADMSDLDEDLRSIRRYRGVLALQVTDPRGRVLHESSDQMSEYGRRNRDAVTRAALDKRGIVTAIESDILSVAAPVLTGETLAGAIHVDISLADLMTHVGNLRREVANISAEERSALIRIIGLAAFVLGIVGLLIGILVARGLSHPIKALSAATRRIGQGEDALELPTERSDEIGDLARDLHQMSNSLRQADRMARLATVGEVAVGVAHELNQPLNTIRMAADNALAALDEPVADPAYLRGKLDLVSQLAGRMGEQIQRMCAVGRRDERRITFDPLPSVRDALALHSGGLEAEGIELAVTWPDETPAFVQGLPHQFMQVIVNLIANARDAIIEQGDTPMGRLRSVRGRLRVSLAVDEIGRELRLEIADNGGGIPPEIIGRIFDPFFTTKEVNKGTGLGLSISYGIVAGMGGHINVRNGTRGAIFSVVLPLVSGADARAAE
jgi:signal transduction histidine kinase